MRQGDVRTVLTRTCVLEQPLTEAIEVARTSLGWQEHAMTVEACSLTEGQTEWTCYPGLGTAQ